MTDEQTDSQTNGQTEGWANGVIIIGPSPTDYAFYLYQVSRKYFKAL